MDRKLLVYFLHESGIMSSSRIVLALLLLQCDRAAKLAPVPCCDTPEDCCCCCLRSAAFSAIVMPSESGFRAVRDDDDVSVATGLTIDTFVSLSLSKRCDRYGAWTVSRRNIKSSLLCSVSFGISGMPNNFLNDVERTKSGCNKPTTFIPIQYNNTPERNCATALTAQTAAPRAAQTIFRCTPSCNPVRRLDNVNSKLSKVRPHDTTGKIINGSGKTSDVHQ